MNPSSASILVVDDDSSYVENLKLALSDEYQVSSAVSLKEVEPLLAKKAFRAFILDYHLGGHENGVAILDYLRERDQKQPVIIVSGGRTFEMAKNFLTRRVFGFVEKPVSLAELRTLLAEATRENSLAFQIDASTRRVSFGSEETTLTRIEFEILNIFLKNRRKHVTRDQISAVLWPDTKVSRHTLDTHLINLKRKLPIFADKLVSVYGTGFCYEA